MWRDTISDAAADVTTRRATMLLCRVPLNNRPNPTVTAPHLDSTVSSTVLLVAQARNYLAAWKEDTLSDDPKCAWVCHYRGKQLQKIPKRMWRETCEKVGLKGKLFHDLRRTAERNMVRAGIPERVAMEISGHRTRAMFDRYDIVNETDLSNAVGRLQKRLDLAD